MFVCKNVQSLQQELLNSALTSSKMLDLPGRAPHSQARMFGAYAHVIATYDRFYMSKLDPTAVFSSVDVKTALPNVRVKIQGLPEDVQWIADALETAIPGAMDWQSFAQTQCDCLIEINGVGQKYNLTSDIELS